MKSLRHLLFGLGCAGLIPAAVHGADSTPVSGDYRIAARDTIDFQVHSQPDTVTRQRVTANGELQLPFIGTVNVAGRTVREAEKFLEAQLRDGGFFVAPQVILSVEHYREGYISLLGQVKNPDRVQLPLETSSIGMLQAVAQVGGFTRIARTDAVQVLRMRSDGVQDRITVNMDAFLKSKSPASLDAEFQLRPGDVVFVPERTF